MRSIAIQFVIFALMLPFMLHLCTAAAPKHSKSLESSGKLDVFIDLENYYTSEGFKKRCHNQLERGRGRIFPGVDDADEIEMNDKANLNMDIAPQKMVEAIRKCSASIDSPYICTKAVRNLECLLEYVSQYEATGKAWAVMAVMDRE